MQRDRTLVSTLHIGILPMLFLLSMQGVAQVIVLDEPPEDPPRPLLDFYVVSRRPLEDGIESVRYNIVNNSPDTVRFLWMSCSEEDLFVMDSLSLHAFLSWECDTNVPTIMSLAPHHIQNGRLKMAGSSSRPRYLPGPFRIGWRHMPLALGADVMKAFREREKTTVVWSAPLAH